MVLMMDDETATAAAWKELMEALAKINAECDEALTKNLAEYDTTMAKLGNDRRRNTLFSWLW